MKRTIRMFILFFAFLIGAGSYTIYAQNPPAHAQAHGVKKKYKYYPDCNVYFNPVTKRYTYYGGGRWTTVVNLPSNIRLIGNGSDFDFDGDDPWKENSKHKSQYKKTVSTKNYEIKKIDDNYDSKSNKGNENKGNGKKNK